MAKTCPVLTPAERRYCEILDHIEAEMMRNVHAALQAAIDRAHSEIPAGAPDAPPPSDGYFKATLHQQMFCTLCGANPDDFSGGSAVTAVAVIRNMTNIANHYWKAGI